MTTIKATILILTLGLYSCNNGKKNKAEVSTDTITSIEKVNDTLNKTPKYSDSIGRFEVDNYPVPDEMLNCIDSSSICEIKYKELISVDKIWFTNDTLNQTLVFEMYTDKHRLAIFHFYNASVPAELIKRMELSTLDREMATDKQKLENFMGFLSSRRKINSNYFKSDKGFKLGDSKENIINKYGRPDKVKISKGIEEYEWDFIGDILYDGKESLKGKPLAKESYGHQASLYFKNNKLIGVFLHNDIP